MDFVNLSEFYFSNISSGDILYFSNDMIDNEEPHPHIVILKDDTQKYLFTICTSKVEKTKIIFEKLNKPFETLVIVNPNTNNGLTKETAINCNNCFSLSENVLKYKHQNNLLSHKGKLEPHYFSQIIKGLLFSDEIEEEIKDMINENLSEYL